MRQIGRFPKQSDAQRFAAYLVTLGIPAHAEEEPDDWVIWVRDEDQLEKAKDEIQQFRVDPSASCYRGVEREAESIRQDEIKRREKIRKNVVVMGGRWRQGVARKAPLVFTLIALSVAASIWTSWGQNSNMGQLAFRSTKNKSLGPNPGELARPDPLIDVRRGQLWRLVTPIFVHLGILHLVFNVYMLHYFGSQIEDRRGTLRLGLLVLTIAVVSNIAQATIESPWFGGMSGVIYGLFGYVWMKTLYEPGAGLFVSRGTITWLTIWFFLCLAGVLGSIANTAHGAGLVVGVAIGYAPVLARSLKENKRK